MVENEGKLNLSEYLVRTEDNGHAQYPPQDPAQVVSPYLEMTNGDFKTYAKRSTLFENFVADGGAQGLGKADLEFTKTVMDSIEAIYKNPDYREGTSNRRKFDAFIAALNLGSKYIRQVNENFSDEKMVPLNEKSIVDSEDPYVDNMVKMLGANLYVDRIIHDQVDVARRNGAGEHMEVAGRAFVENALVLIYRVEDGFRLRDFTDADSLIATGRLAGVVSLIFQRDDTRVTEEASEEDSDYHARNSLQSYLTIFSFMKNDAILNYRSRSQIESESYKHSSLFLNSVLRLREEATKALFDPEHPDHAGVSEIMVKALSVRESKDLSLLYIMDGDAQGMYRKAKGLMDVEEDSAVAHLILSAIDKEIEKKGANLIKVQELSEIGADKSEDVEPDYYTQTKLRVHEIFSYTSVLEYELEGAEIGSDLLVAPSQVNVRFEKNKPHEFEIELHYQNEHGEETSMDYTVDCKKGEFEWSLLDDPGKETGYKNTFLKYAESVLEAVARKAKLVKASKKKEESTVDVHSRPRRKGISNRPKRAPFEGKDNTKDVVHDISFEEEKVEDTTVVREIITPNEQDLKALLKKLDHSDRDIVMARLQAFNARGVGRIQVLKKGGNSRKSISGNALGKYIVTGRNGGVKGIRVLVERIGAIQGSETWGVVAVDYRENIYGGKKLDKI